MDPVDTHICNSHSLEDFFFLLMLSDSAPFLGCCYDVKFSPFSSATIGFVKASSHCRSQARGFCSRCSSKLFHTQGLLSSLLSFMLWICIRIQSSCQLGVPRPYVRHYTFYYTPNFLLSCLQRVVLFSRSNAVLNNGITSYSLSRSFCEQSDYIYVELSLFLQLLPLGYCRILLSLWQVDDDRFLFQWTKENPSPCHLSPFLNLLMSGRTKDSF